MIIATAGHVDHGKTALVRQLTGVDTDRLPEEKRRGLSIDLGFAYRHVAGGTSLGFVDVPGHTRFINTMIAGVSGIDLGMLVVAADDGIMPQTREHLAVLRLLGIQQFLGVITKTDRVEPERQAAVEAAVDELLAGDWPLFAVSNHTGEGVDALRDYLETQAQAHRRRSSSGNFRLSVDRSFVLKGAGLVLTGTAIAGQVKTGDSLYLLPQGTPLRVRALRVQNRESTSGAAGDRCALNVTGAINQQQVQRGDMLAASDELPLSTHCDARISLLDEAPFPVRHLSPVRVHIGARRLAARLYLIAAPAPGKLQPGESALAQLLFEQPLPCCRGDRFLLRDDSESATLGGGMVLDPLAPQAGKGRAARLHYLQAMSQHTIEQALVTLLHQDAEPVNLSALCRAWNVHPLQQQTLLAGLEARSYNYQNETWAVHPMRWQGLAERVLNALREWHAGHPDQHGIRASTLQQTLHRHGRKGLLHAVLADQLSAGAIALHSGLLRLTAFKPAVSREQQSQWQGLAQTLHTSGLQPPLVSELAGRHRLEQKQTVAVLQSAARSGEVVKLNDNRYALPSQLLACADIVRELADSASGITVVAFKARIGAGRKVAIEILEHFDTIRFTQRRDDHRVILDTTIPAQRYGGR